MREYEIYLPTTHPDGTPVDAGKTRQIEKTLTEIFGGYTHLKHRSDGAWRMGGVTFHDEITILRVLDDGSAGFDMAGFKKELEATFQQHNVLIVTREVGVID